MNLSGLTEQISRYNFFPPKESITRGDEIHINEAAIGCLRDVILEINSRASCFCSTFHPMWELLTKEDKCVVVNSPSWVGNYYQFHHWKWDTEVRRLSLKSLRNPWLAGAALDAPELRSDRATGELVATPLPTASLSCLLSLCKREGREEEEQLQFLIFCVICFSASNWLDISDLNIKFVNSLQSWAFGGEMGREIADWEGLDVGVYPEAV